MFEMNEAKLQAEQEKKEKEVVSSLLCLLFPSNTLRTDADVDQRARKHFKYPFCQATWNGRWISESEERGGTASARMEEDSCQQFSRQGGWGGSILEGEA